MRDAVPDACLHQLFERRTHVAPDAIAVVQGDCQTTYRSLNRRADRLADRLRSLGVAPGQLAGVYLKPSTSMVVAVLGILKTGAAYVPLDPSYPKERLSAMAGDADLKVVVTSDTLQAEVPTIGAHLTAVSVDEVSSVLGSPHDGIPAIEHDPRSLAYVIFTSGSTGRPKGVEIPHRAVVNTVVDINRRFGVGPSDRVLALSSLSFDLSVYDIFGLLAAGGTIVLPRDGKLRDPAQWVEEVRCHGVTLWNSVPAMMEMLVDHLESAGIGSLGDIRVVLLSGDWIPVRLPQRIRRLHRHAQIISLGGATEASIWSICFPIDRIEEHWTSIPYGRPLSGQAIHVLDEQLRPCPVAEAGELYIGGVGVASGYRNQPALTAARFVRDPLSSDPDARLYRTGDRGRLLPDGNIELLGRVDHQVKINGFRIELGEIDESLSAHPAVRHAVTTVRETYFGTRQLISYIVVHGESAWSPDDLREFLARRLPAYMLPVRFVRLEAMPLTANGKVDRSALPALRDCSYTAPRNEVQERLCAIFADLFDRPKCGINDDFFELGGDSLMSRTLVHMLENEFQRRLSPDLLAEHPTIERLAEVLQQRQPGSEVPASFTIRAGGSAPPLFCLPGIGGEFHGFCHLAAALPEDRPVYGLRLLRELDSRRRPTTLAEAAAAWIAEVRRVQDRGPYHLAGYSLGGTYAYEMACQLAEQGHSVALLALLDTPRSFATDLRVPWWKQLRQQWNNLVACEGAARFQYLATRTRILLAHCGRKLFRWPADFQDLEEAGIGLYLPPKMREAARASWRLVRAYQPRPLDGRLVLFRATQQDDANSKYLLDSHLGWSGLPRHGIELHDIPGTHVSMFNPVNIPRMAAALEAHFKVAPVESQQEMSMASCATSK
jgi:amino acid adenylation domain-containing protein